MFEFCFENLWCVFLYVVKVPIFCKFSLVLVQKIVCSLLPVFMFCLFLASVFKRPQYNSANFVWIYIIIH